MTTPDETTPQETSPEETTDDMDALLDDIDSVLEDNASDFVRGFVQKGGQ